MIRDKIGEMVQQFKICTALTENPSSNFWHPYHVAHDHIQLYSSVTPPTQLKTKIKPENLIKF